MGYKRMAALLLIPFQRRGGRRSLTGTLCANIPETLRFFFFLLL